MATTTSPAIPANAMTPAAWDTLNSDYATAYQNALKGGQTDATWAKSPEFLGFQNRTLEGVGNTYDTSKLQSDIASMSGGFDNPIYGDNFRKIVGAEQNRLGFLNGQNSIPEPTPMPSMQNYSQSSNPAYGNPLIAALRANSPAPARQASGIEDISTGKIFNTPKDATWVDSPQRVRDRSVVSTDGKLVELIPNKETQKLPSAPLKPIPYIPPAPGDEMDQPHWDSLNNDYATAFASAMKGGMTEKDWAATPEFKGFQNSVITGAAETYDIDKLKSDIASMTGGFDDPIYGDNYRKIVAAETKQLNKLLNEAQARIPD